MPILGRKPTYLTERASKTSADLVPVQSKSAYFDLSRAKRAAKKVNPLPRITRFINTHIILHDGAIDFRQQSESSGASGFQQPQLLSNHSIAFNFKQLKAATRNFSSDNKLGEGGFGKVYRGILPNGVVIAVKQLSSKSKQGSTEFVNEVVLISTLVHPNLVRLLGCCNENKQFLLVYEYVENNSLSNALFGPANLKSRLDWETRLKICLGIAKGLAYLHEESTSRVVHRDIKLSNILLDKDLNAKISDFGLAKNNDGENSYMITKIAGTNGYMAPEYAMRGHLTTKADVYSFGVVMLEIFSGKSNVDYRPNDETVFLLDMAYVLQRRGDLLELMDPDLNMNYPLKEAAKVLDLAMLCTDPSPAPRPKMSEVVSILEGRTDMKSLTLPARYMHDFQKVNVLADLCISTHSGFGISRDGTTISSFASGMGREEKLDKPMQSPELHEIPEEKADVLKEDEKEVHDEFDGGNSVSNLNDNKSISGMTDGGGNKDDGNLLIGENVSITSGSTKSSNAMRPWTTSVHFMDHATKMDEDKGNKLEYVEPSFDEYGKLHIKCSEEVFDAGCNEWKDSLIGFFVSDEKPPFNVDKEKIEKLCGLKEEAVSVFTLQNGYYLFRFKHVEDKIKVLESGPWHIEHWPLVLREWDWKLKFDRADNEIKYLPIWVKIYNLPLFLWSSSLLSMVGSGLGTPLYSDQKTKNKERLDFARLCIQVDASKQLPESLNITVKGIDYEIKLEYDWKPLRCATCCTFGHEESKCMS